MQGHQKAFIHTNTHLNYVKLNYSTLCFKTYCAAAFCRILVQGKHIFYYFLCLTLVFQVWELHVWMRL